MGKDWYWGSASTSNCSGKKETSYGEGGRRSRTNPSGGCISTVFQLFSFTHFHSPYAVPHQIHSLKGIEAPRNSLELESEERKASSSKEDENLPIPIKTGSCGDDLSSPSQVVMSRSPTLVARLMGLDLFPDSSSVNSHTHRPGSSGSRSLPETPRVSSSVDAANHRMSLQENKTPKQSVGKRVGLMDITNHNTPVSRNRQQRRDQELLIIRSKKSDNNSATRLRLLENKNATKRDAAKPSHPRTMSPLQPKETKKSNKKQRFRSRLDKPPQTSDITRKRKQQQQQQQQQQQPFLRPSSTVNHKKTPLLPAAVNKDRSPPATQIPLLQDLPSKESRQSLQFLSCATQKYSLGTHTSAVQGSSDASTVSGGAEYQYVTRILKRMGIEKDTTVSTATWFSPSHPVAPSIFHQLEPSHHHYHYADTATRKLMFHLVDEMLVEILSPYTNTKPWSTCTNNDIARNFRHVKLGSELVDTLCAKIRSFPAKDCRTLEDIDSIIDGDSPEWKLRDISRSALEDQGESLVKEIEKHVVDTLLNETTSMVLSLHR